MPGPIREYLLSVPERVLRSATALVAGFVRETGDVVIPGFLRRTRLYSVLVESSLRFLIEQVGQVEGAYPSEEKLAETFLLRRTAGNGLELIGILAFRASPVWVLAALSDLSGAGRHLVAEIAQELQSAGLLDPGAHFETVDQILDGLQAASGRLAETCNTPPLDVEGLRAEWKELRRELSRFPTPDPAAITALWTSLRTESKRQGRTIFEMSALMSVSAVRLFGKGSMLAARRTGEALATALLEHYRQALLDIHETGYLRYWAREFRPYLRAAVEQFSPRRQSLTQRLLRRGAGLLILTILPLQGAVQPADLRAHVEFLSNDLMEGRSTPSKGQDIAAEYIAAQFRRAGLEPQPDGTYFQVASEGCRNVVGVLRGVDPKLSDTYVLVSAHYDHVPLGKEGTGDVIHNGANDNASGVATVIEIARNLAGAKLRPKRTVVFMAFYGEEQGMVGSRYYAANPIFPIDGTIAQVNFEQTGRTDDLEGANIRTLNVTGFEYSEVGQILAGAAAARKVRVTKRPKWSDQAFERSDNEALARKGVPSHTMAVTFMFPDYHKPADEWNKLDYENMAIVTDAAAAGILVLANREQAPHWYVGAPFGGASATALSRPVPRPAKPVTRRARTRRR